MLGHPWGGHPPQHLPASAVPDDGVLMSAGSAASVVTGEQERGREPRLGRVLKPIACQGRANPLAQHPSTLFVLVKRRVRGLRSPTRAVSLSVRPHPSAFVHFSLQAAISDS